MTLTGLLQIAGAVIATLALALWSIVIAGAFFGLFLIVFGVALELTEGTDAARTTDSPPPSGA